MRGRIAQPKRCETWLSSRLAFGRAWDDNTHEACVYAIAVLSDVAGVSDGRVPSAGRGAQRTCMGSLRSFSSTMKGLFALSAICSRKDSSWRWPMTRVLPNQRRSGTMRVEGSSLLCSSCDTTLPCRLRTALPLLYILRRLTCGAARALTNRDSLSLDAIVRCANEPLRCAALTSAMRHKTCTAALAMDPGVRCYRQLLAVHNY